MVLLSAKFGDSLRIRIRVIELHLFHRLFKEGVPNQLLRSQLSKIANDSTVNCKQQSNYWPYHELSGREGELDFAKEMLLSFLLSVLSFSNNKHSRPRFSRKANKHIEKSSSTVQQLLVSTTE